MRDHDRAGWHQRAEEDYEQEEYDDYEEEAAGSEEDDVQEDAPEDPKPTKEEQEFLSLREKLKEKIRQKLKKQSATTFGHSAQSQEKKRTITNDKFGSFFGPSQPVIAARVLEESRSIRENQHIVVSKVSNSSSDNKRNSYPTQGVSRTYVHNQKPKSFSEITKKAQTLKDMRDYSFLDSDDVDLPFPSKELPPRKVSIPTSDSRAVQPPPKTSKIPMNKPSDHEFKKSLSSNQYVQAKAGSQVPVSRPKPATAESRKVQGGSVGNKGLPHTVPSQAMGNKKPPVMATNDPRLKKTSSSVKPHSSTQGHSADRGRMTQASGPVRSAPKPPLSSSSKPQPPKQIPHRGLPEDRLKKKPVKKNFYEEEDDDAEAIQMIRQMFRYNPNKYAGDDEDDSDMEVGFGTIQKEERWSAKIARKEDEEQLRLIEEEERRERMRKKQKQSRH